MRCLLWAFVSLLLTVMTSVDVSGQQPKSLTYSVIYSDSDDLTHFRDEELPWQVLQLPADPRHPGLETPFLDAEKLGFLRLSIGTSSDQHPAPGKRFVMVLSGVAEIEVGDGQRRKFGAGSVLLVTDVTGRGHRTKVLGDQDVFLVWVPVP
jgi:Cupin domain